LPDFANLGVVLRIVVAVNLLVLAAALVREERWENLWSTLLELAAFVEPHLLAELMVLFALAPWLAGLGWQRGAAAVASISTAIGAGFVLLHRQVFPDAPSMSRYLLFTLAATVLLLGYFQLRSRALSPALAEARLQALQARIRPHFLFNSLNAVLSLVRREPRRAETALEDLADLFRVLMRDNRELVPLADEVELCRQYLALETLRLEDRLQVHWHVDKMPADALVPPLVLQPLLENAVYHGIEPFEGRGVISINIFQRHGNVHAVLRNPYHQSARHAVGNRMAVQNIRERLALHFDVEAGMDVKVIDGTYRVHIRMPYRGAPVAGRATLAVARG
jgi:two-component system sensor histidine kinase AlgZ